ncbi:MAG: polysaccharide biosynthesis/export family protein [Kiritimatiellia bacterium]
MNFARRYVGCLAARWVAGVCLVLTAGCASSSSSQKVYDRYAELVAQRNQPGVAAAPAARTADKPAAAAPAAAARKPAPPAAKAPAPAPRPAPAAEPRPAPQPAPAPAAAPVQILAPKPAETAPAPAPAAPPPAPAAVSAPAPAPATVEPAVVADAGYRLKVGDGIQVFLRGIPGGEAIEDVIDEAGMITLPFINEILAAGLTASELERNVRQTYLDQDIYRNITVNVVVPTRYYFIQGEVRAPGRFQIMSATRVSQAIAASGGYTEYASGKVQIKRRGQIVKVIKNARRLERTPDDDLLLEPDDVIEVLRSWF